jgi:hypothetical protein
VKKPRTVRARSTAWVGARVPAGPLPPAGALLIRPRAEGVAVVKVLTMPT